jgi:polysaccharide chain length determinant protein (PEP-CTERM system associated)
MEERRFHPLDYLTVLRRRKRWFIIPVVVCLAAGALAALFLPRAYASKATIGVAAPTLSPDLLKGVSSLDATERQRAVSQHLLSPAVLERVVREEQIDPAKKTEDVGAWLRARVSVEVPKPIGLNARSDRTIDSFELFFTDSDPERTRRITDKLAQVFVEENSRQTTARAENTVEVLGAQLRASQDRLDEIEEQLRSKKERYMGRLPDQVDANLQTANGLRNQLESISTQLSMESNQLLLLETQLDQMRQGGSNGAALTTAATTAIQLAQNRINQLNQELVQARALGYTDKHPEVVHLQAEIAQARTELKSVKQDTGTVDTLQADPIYRQKVAERDALKGRINSLRRAETNVRGQIASYQGRVESAPMVEQEMSGVQRAHALETTRYNELKARYDAAVLQGDIARQQGGERFSILYGASRPLLVSPSAVKMLAMALAAGLMLGAVLLVGREFMDRSVHDARALQSEFELPVLGEIPTIHRAV